MPNLPSTLLLLNPKAGAHFTVSCWIGSLNCSVQPVVVAVVVVVVTRSVTNPNSNVIWNLYGCHMGTHVADTWYFVSFAPDHPYGCHMGKPHGFYVGTTWYTHMVNRCETHMGKLYVCYMSDIWLTHVTPIWVVGCKPHEIPYVYHIVVFFMWSAPDHPYGYTTWVLCGYHMVHTCGLPL